MAITGGFGMTMDLERGTMRKWVMGRDGVKRWADSGEPVDQCDVPPIGWRCTRGEGHSGPCAAIECPEDVALVERGMRRLRETPNTEVKPTRGAGSA